MPFSAPFFILVCGSISWQRVARTPLDLSICGHVLYMLTIYIIDLPFNLRYDVTCVCYMHWVKKHWEEGSPFSLAWLGACSLPRCLAWHLIPFLPFCSGAQCLLTHLLPYLTTLCLYVFLFSASAMACLSVALQAGHCFFLYIHSPMAGRARWTTTVCCISPRHDIFLLLSPIVEGGRDPSSNLPSPYH